MTTVMKTSKTIKFDMVYLPSISPCGQKVMCGQIVNVINSSEFFFF